VITVVVQVNGKLRDRLEVPKGTPKEELERLARLCPKVETALRETPARKVIVVPDRLVNFVV
jgi:leucyl-tRNA synthetase